MSQLLPLPLIQISAKAEAEDMEILVSDSSEEEFEGEPNLKSRKSIFEILWTKFGGIILVILCGACQALSNVLVKVVPEFHAFNLGFWKSLGVFTPPALALLWRGSTEIFATACPLPFNNNSGRWKIFLLLMGRGLSGTAGLTGKMYTFQYLPAGDASVIIFSSPIFVTIMAYSCLREKCRISHFISAFMVLIGITIIARPSFLFSNQCVDESHTKGIFMAIFCTLALSTSVITLRGLKSVNSTLILFVFGGMSLAVNSVLAITTGYWEWPNGILQWSVAIGQAGLGFLAHYLLTKALSMEQAAIISLGRSTEVISSFVWQFIILSVIPDGLSILGAVIILSAVSIGILEKIFSSFSAETPAPRVTTINQEKGRNENFGRVSDSSNAEESNSGSLEEPDDKVALLSK